MMQRIVLASGLFGLASATTVSPVAKVVQLLGELRVKVEKDLANETKAMEEYAEYCDDEIKEKGFNIKTAGSDIERYQAAIEDADGKIQQLAALLETSGAETAAKQAELAKAKDVRATEHGDFVAAEKELVDTVDMLARASSVLKRELSFVQAGSKTKSQVLKKMGAMVDALGAIVSASWMDSSSARKVKSFLATEDDDLSLAQQPQAASYNYESKSGGIVDTLNDMKDKAQDQLAGLRRDETKGRHAFEMLQQSLNDAVDNLSKVIAEAGSNKAAASQAKAQAEEDLAKTQDAKAADEAYKAKMEQTCARKNAEWETRQKTAGDEIAALVKAKEILSGGVKVFAQVGTKTQRVAANDSNRQELVSAIRKLGRKFNSFGLMQLAGRAASDPFGKVRGLISNMIANLEKQAQSDATQEAFCDEEKAKSQKKRQQKEGLVEKYQTRLDKANAAVATLTQEIGDLNAQLQAIAKANAEATKLRQEQKAEFDVSSKDQKESIDAVARAIEVLQGFYGNAALLQQPALGGARSDSGNNIISFLEVAQSDFSNMLVENEAQEAEAKKAYEQLMQDNAVAKATKDAEVKGKTSEVKQLKVAIENTSSDLSIENKELDAVLDYIEKLKPQCESKAMSYEERKARRDEEIAGLKNALEILDVEDASASFLQKDTRPKMCRKNPKAKGCGKGKRFLQVDV